MLGNPLSQLKFDRREHPIPCPHWLSQGQVKIGGQENCQVPKIVGVILQGVRQEWRDWRRPALGGWSRVAPSQVYLPREGGLARGNILSLFEFDKF